jgi:hypothetical protein
MDININSFRPEKYARDPGDETAREDHTSFRRLWSAQGGAKCALAECFRRFKFLFLIST